MSLDDFARNLVVWSTPRFGLKNRVNKALCFLGFHSDDTYLVSDLSVFQRRRGTQFFGKGVQRIIRVCHRCESIR